VGGGGGVRGGGGGGGGGGNPRCDIIDLFRDYIQCN
jgi:hypothetical protein